MTTRGRHNNEWDQMREDHNNSYYESHYGDDDSSETVQLNHCRLYVVNIPKGLSEDGLRTAFSKYGTLQDVFMSKDPQKKYALITYDTPGEAKLAMTKLNNTEPMKLHINIAKSKGRKDINQSRGNMDRSYSNGPSKRNFREDNASISSKRSSRLQEEFVNGDEMEEALPSVDEDIMDPDIKIKGIQLELQRLQVQEQTVALRQQLLQLEASRKKNVSQTTTTSSSNRCILPDGRIVVRNVNDRNLESRDTEGSFAAGAGDSNVREPACARHSKPKSCWDHQDSAGSSSPSTCVLCSEDLNTKESHNRAKSVVSKYTEISQNSDYSSRCDKTTDLSKNVGSKVDKTELSKSDVTSKKMDGESDVKRWKSEVSCDFKYSDLDSDDEADETNRLIQLRNSDYMDIVGDSLKVVIALAGYPRSKMRLRQMEVFQKSLNDVIDMQLKAGLLKKVPAFFDYYLNRGAIVCICKDVGTRDWIVRVSPGLQERMCTNLILLKAKVKRLCLAVLKIPNACWPVTAQDAFKLLKYFNPTLKTYLWKIYAQKTVDGVESTSFFIDRVSGEIIRGPNFKNVIDYSQMEFELTGYTEIYYDSLLSDLDDLYSVASRVKLLEELKSADVQSKNSSDKQKQESVTSRDETYVAKPKKYDSDYSESEGTESVVDDMPDERNEVDSTVQKIKDVDDIGGKDEISVWSDDTNNLDSDHETEVETGEARIEEECIENSRETLVSAGTVSDNTEVIDNNEMFASRSSNLNIDSNRGIAYHRRTNYLDVENELKIAITLEDYPQSKLEGTHIRRLKHLFKEYLHKDMKMKRFANLIIPKFQDVYLSNGAVIYICDSLETKDYLTEVLPKFINATGLKLAFRDIKSLVRYTRVVLRLPKEYAHVESIEILQKLQSRYPGLNPDCWKHYSDVAGKQKRQFGVDPESLDVIKSPDFEPLYEGEKLFFRIIDRQKRDVNLEEAVTRDENMNDTLLKDRVVKLMYDPVNPEITKTPLHKLRANHYTNLIDDDLKLYVGPSVYPDKRVDEVLFHIIKKTFENVACDAFGRGDIDENRVPKFHDMYLFDGVIFVICQNIYSREWIEQSVSTVNAKLGINLKANEFRGAVGIVSMMVKTHKEASDIITALQKQNPRIRTKYWRQISTVRSNTKLDVILQIDKLSAQVITSPDFNKYVDGNPVQFKLGHLQSLIKPKFSLEALTKLHLKKIHGSNKENANKKESGKKTIEELKCDIKRKYPYLKIDQWDVISKYEDDLKVCNYAIDENSCKIVEKESKEDNYSNVEPFIIEPAASSDICVDILSPVDSNINKRVFLKIPSSLLTDGKEDLSMIFDLLEDKNPGLNTELWKVLTQYAYSGNCLFAINIDIQSASVMKSKNFDSKVCGEALKFYF